MVMIKGFSWDIMIVGKKCAVDLGLKKLLSGGEGEFDGVSLSTIFIPVFLKVSRWIGLLAKHALGVIYPPLGNNEVCKFQYVKQYTYFLSVCGEGEEII